MVDFNSTTPMTIVNVIGVNIGTVKSYEVRRPKYILYTRNYKKGFPESSVGKEYTCNAGDPGLIPGLGRSSEEGIDYPLQYFWASLLAQSVNNSPAVQETWLQPLGWEDPLEKGKATHSGILAWRIPWTMQRVGHA